MKSKTVNLVAFIVAIILVTTIAYSASYFGASAGYKSATKASSTTNLPITKQAETTTKAASSSTTTPVSSTSTSNSLPTVAAVISYHSAAQFATLKGLCLTCHGAGTPYQFPLPSSWNGATYGSTEHTGTYTVAAGSPADHTGRTADQCTQAGCHAVPTS